MCSRPCQLGLVPQPIPDFATPSIPWGLVVCGGNNEAGFEPVDLPQSMMSMLPSHLCNICYGIPKEGAHKSTKRSSLLTTRGVRSVTRAMLCNSYLGYTSSFFNSLITSKCIWLAKSFDTTLAGPVWVIRCSTLLTVGGPKLHPECVPRHFPKSTSRRLEELISNACRRICFRVSHGGVPRFKPVIVPVRGIWCFQRWVYVCLFMSLGG